MPQAGPFFFAMNIDNMQDIDRQPAETQRKAPRFAPAEPLELSDEDAKDIADRVCRLYRSGQHGRDAFLRDHQDYDAMFRGRIADNYPRNGPWEGSANLHVQAPFWLVDALSTRLTGSIWNQNPLVVGIYEGGGDEKVADLAAKRVEWNLQPSRMDARSLWARASRIRSIHGVGVLQVGYAHTKYLRRQYMATPEEIEPEIMRGPDGRPMLDSETGEPILRPAQPATTLEEETRYRGPTLYPHEYDDIIIPVGCMNLQPHGPDNPGGATHAIIREWQAFSYLRQQHDAGTYPNLFDDLEDEQAWIDAAPAQDRSSGLSGADQERERQHDRAEGVNRTHESSGIRSRDDDPEYEVLTCFMPMKIRHPETKQDYYEECVIFVCQRPQQTLGVFLLSDIVWSGRRPLIALHYQVVSNRFWSMGVCELCRHLSAELDTIHNMRLDVGFITNMPFFFYGESSNFDPDRVVVRPLKGIPVDDAAKITFPSFNNVTTFYEKEELLLLSLVERVFGITDLFLGVSPTRGAAARTATGFAGTQQESMARVSEIIQQDAKTFSDLCKLVYELDLQYGPPERSFRLHGQDYDGLTVDDLWFQQTYDFRLGANLGSFSQGQRIQQAQAILQLAGASPLTNQAPGRRWEAECRYYRALGLSDAEVEALIGPKSAVDQGTPRPQREENEDMVQWRPRPGVPAQVHPSDDDMGHMREVNEFMSSETYEALGRPNEMAFMQHFQLHIRQNMAKQAQMQQAQGQGQPPGPTMGASPMVRANAQVQNTMGAGGGGSFDDLYRASMGGNGQRQGPPPLPSFLEGNK